MEIFGSENLTGLIKAIGYFGIFAMVFAESGIFIGAFFPGDSLLFTAGFLASQGFLNIYFLVPLIFVGAVLGDNVGYAFGRKLGPKIFKKENSLLFRKEHLERASEFYKTQGPKTIVLARFIPIVRTFAPIVAGVGKMEYKKFLFYNIIGGALWAFSVTLAGYFLGQVVPDIDRYLLPIILAIVVVSILPTVLHVLKERRTKKGVTSGAK